MPHRTQGNICICCFIIEDVTKDTDDCSGERYRGQGPEGFPSAAGAFVPMELGCGCVHLPGNPLNSLFWDFYGGFIT